MDEADLALFLRIASLGSLSAAARDGGLSVALVSARLAAFEKQLGVRLFHRSTRRLSLSQDGRVLLPHAERLIEAMAEARAELGGAGRLLSGTLRLTASASLGRMHLIEPLARFQRLHPGVRIDLQLSDSVVDLIEDAFDLGIRVAEDLDPGLVARRLAWDRRLLCAAPEYLERRGLPRHPEDLREHDCLILHDQTRWRFSMPDGSELTVKVGGGFRCNHSEVTREAAVQGLGIALKSLWNAGQELASGRLMPVLEHYPLASRHAIWAVYPSSRLLAPRVRALVDFLAEEWRLPPWESGPAET
ncbi:MAG: LysR family transcriptional regulator [Gammaproteobacteria bacterium]|nr:LysR family transcriptional regulator [Gammaproteobacteria bacterium]